MKNKLIDILSSAQVTKASHQNKLRVLKQYYEKVSQEEFFEELFEVLSNIFHQSSVPTKNEYVERILDFLAQFVSFVTPTNDIEDDFNNESAPAHPFLTRIILETLKYHDLPNESLRYNSCLFVRLILQHIGCEINLDNDICDMIEEAMLERIADPKSSIRLQAVMALLRLQEPTNPDCPVIKAFLSLIVDGNATIRAEVVKTVAPYTISIPQIVNRLKDVDSNVRLMAFRRCADLGPKYFKIIERQRIMQCGLSETLPKIKKVFLDNLLTKWLNVYNENFIIFLGALKLDADESDIVNSESISKEVMNLLFSTISIENVIGNLSMDENKLIPIQKLSIEAVNLWNITVNYLRNHEDMDEYLDDVLPELTTFCIYMESFISEKMNKKMEDWEYLSYQHIVHNLFEIVEGYDFSDEVGRKNLYELLMKILREEDFQFKVKKKLISLASHLTPKTEDYTSIICHVISEIREPLIEKIIEDEPVLNTNLECQKAELKVKIIMLGSELEDATDRQEFLKADAIKKDLDKLKIKLKEFDVPQPTVEMTKVSKDDPKTVCNCLDILIALLELPRVQTLTPSLVTVKDEFIIPLLDSNIAEINWRVINCLALICILDENLAEQYIKIICIPIITYREIPIHHKHPLIISVKSISDLYRIYGANIFGSMEDTTNMTIQTNQTRRRLYRNDDTDESSTVSPNRFQLESIIEIMLDMLDDEISEIRDACVTAILKLILNNFPVTPLFITRIVLKWYNPLTVKASDQLQHILGVLIGSYTSTIAGAREVMAKAVIPILTSIASAPVTSPLADVDIDNLLNFLAVITNSDGKKDLVNTHLSMAHMFCYEMMKKKNAPIVHHLSKLLLYLDIPPENDSSIKELILQVKITLQEENLLEKVAKKNMSKFLQKLISCLEEHTGITTLETINEETIETSNTNISNDNSNVNEVESNVDNRNSEDSNKVSINKTACNKESHNSRVNEVNDQNNHCQTEAIPADLFNENNSTGETIEGSINQIIQKKNNKKRTRTKPTQHGTDQIKSVNNSFENLSDSLTDTDVEQSHPKRAGKKLKVCITRNKFEGIRNDVKDHSTPEQNNENILNVEASSHRNKNQPNRNVDESNIKNINVCLPNSNKNRNTKSKICESTEHKRNNSIPPVRSDVNEPIIENSKRKNKARKVTKNRHIDDNRKSGSDSENSSDLETELKRISKRLKLHRLDLNKNGKIDGHSEKINSSKLSERKNNVNKDITLRRSGRPPNSQNTTDHRPPRIHSFSSETKRTASSNIHNTRTSKDFISDEDTTLHTILHDISQISEMHDVSSFSSPNDSFSSQRSLRSNGSAIVPSLNGNTKKIIGSDKSSSGNSKSLRRSARKTKRKKFN